MALITLLQAQLAFGDAALLDKADFALQPNERIGLIGRNGTGKSSLLKILAGLEKPDDGVLQLQQNLRIAYVAQEPIFDASLTVFQAVSLGLQEALSLINRYTNADEHTDLDALQSQIEALDGWNWQQRVEETLQRLRLDRTALIHSLSGGTQKRVALAQALVTQPDVLLLDEPTNHLDLDAINWLEELLISFSGSSITITHDRAFLDRVATAIVELDRGKLRSYPGNFAQYTLQKEEQQAQESVIFAKANKLLAQEEIWVRKGVEARRTRSTSRINRLEALRATRLARRTVLGSVKFDLASGTSSGKIVAELGNISKSFGAKRVVHNFSATVLRGDKMGLLGPNGAGKTTLLKLILGQLSPDETNTKSSVRLGTNLSIAYFDQMRAALDPNATLADFISPGSEWVEINGQKKHVKSYLGDFLFSPQRANSPVRSLSGGERNRLLLARLFARPANVLVLDEPTNDLDIDTLELLEELLQSYNGTVFLVSHDRRFLDNVVTSLLVYEGSQDQPGLWREYEGGIQDWISQSNRAQALAQVPAPQSTSKTSSPSTPQKPEQPPKKKLSHKEQRELDALPERIEQLEVEQRSLEQTLSDGALYAQDPERAAQISARHQQINEELEKALTQWEVLAQAQQA